MRRIQTSLTLPADVEQWWTPIEYSLWKPLWFVVYEKENWVAYAGVQFPVGNTVYLGPSFVKAEWRGQGMQKNLLVVREWWAVRKGFSGLTSCCYADNIYSIRNLLSCGFIETHRVRDKQGREEVWYEKHI